MKNHLKRLFHRKTNRIDQDEEDTNRKSQKSKISQMYELKKFDHDNSGRVKTYFDSCKVSKNLCNQKYYLNYLFKRMPTLNWIAKYKITSDLLPDFISGITIGIMNIPQVF